MSDTRLYVRLTPKAAQNRIQGWAEDQDGNKILKVGVTAPPDKGKANKALIALLAKELGIPKSSIAIVKGETDRNKILIFKDIPESALDFS